MAGLVPAIHDLLVIGRERAMKDPWMAGTSPAMTGEGVALSVWES